MIGIGVGIIPRTSVTSVSVVTATIATGIGITSFTANWNAFSGAQYYLLDVSTSSSFSTFVYQDQVILAPTTAYVVIGLTENTTYYYRVRASTDVYIDPDYLAFFSRVVAAGGFLTIAEQDSTKQLVADLKANSLWTPMKAIYPMVGASAAACAQNLKDSNFTGTFSSGITYASTGITGNGSSGYMNTSLTPSISLTTANHHISFYSRTNSASSTVDMGVYEFSFGYSGPFFRTRNGSNQFQYGMGTNTSYNDTISSNTDSRGHFIGNILATNNRKSYKNGAISGVNATSGNADSGTGPVFVLAVNRMPLLSSLHSIRECAFASIGDGLTDTQASNFYTAVQKFNQSLNRQVGAQIVSDPDAQAYIDRVYTAGGTLTNTEATAVNQLTIDLKSNGTWSSMKAIYPMIGASAAACAQNLRSSSFTGTFTAGWTFASTGATPNGTSAYMDTSLQMQQISNTTNHLSAYMRASILNDKAILGVTDIGIRYSLLGSTSSETYYNAYNGIFGTSINITRTGLLFGTYISGNEKLFRNGVLQKTTSPITTSTTSTLNYYIGCFNNQGSPLQYINKEISFSSLGDGLSDTQASDFYNSVQNFNQTLDRQVGAQIVSDPDAQSYINRVYTAGGTLTNLEANAVNKLAIDMKAAGLWTSMKAVYPMIGSSAASCAQNLKSSSFTGSFTAGWTFASNGVTPDGTSAYMDTNLVPSTSLLLDSVSLSFYSRTNTQGNIQMGVNDTSNYLIQQMYSSTQMYSQLNGSGGSFIDAPVTQFQGLFTTSRTSNIAVAAYKNGTNIKNDVKSSSSRPVLNFYIGARNNNNSAGNFDNKQCAFASIGDGLDDTQSSNFYTLVQSFNQTLGRSVGSQIVSDADAQAYVNRVYNAGGSLTNTEANAVNQLVLDMKTAGIWTSMKAVYPMVGSSAAACAQNLKSSSFTGTFTSGWTFDSTGATPNGSSAYFDTTLIPNTSLTLTSGHLSFYSRTNNNTGVYDMGTGDGSVQQNLITRYSDDKFYACYGNPGQVLSIANTSSLGFFVTNRNSATNTNSYKNGTQVATGVQTSLLAVQSIYISAFHSSSIYAYSNRQCAFSSIGDGLTDVQATALYNATQIFQNTLGRAI